MFKFSFFHVLVDRKIACVAKKSPMNRADKSFAFAKTPCVDQSELQDRVKKLYELDFQTSQYSLDEIHEK